MRDQMAAAAALLMWIAGAIFVGSPRNYKSPRKNPLAGDDRKYTSSMVSSD